MAGDSTARPIQMRWGTQTWSWCFDIQTVTPWSGLPVLRATQRRHLSALAPSGHVQQRGRLRAFHAEFTRKLPNESSLRTTAKPWFIHQLRVIAHTIQDAAGHPAGGNTTNGSEPVASG
ncbi:hypothetical protein ABZZ80_03790 [Streptomyces sp. NPDC006356]